MAGNVNLIDPNNANINTNMVNGIPPYEDMFISVDLIGVRRGRTVLATNIDTKKTRVQNTGLESDLYVSFLGENQDPNNPAHFNKFTTNWYDGAADRDNTYEGFGINSINVLVNSSFIPQINIEFIDLRGLSFFNRENSPYRILFDFPPPIFYLTIKGYYGKSITYQLHLVKYNTEFKPETGNYHINGEFIAITYAPLTDILFRYIIQAPLMGKNKGETLSSEPGVRPKNTMDLILKLENLYSTIPDKIKTDVDNLKYENAQEKLNSYSKVLDILYGFRDNEILQKNGGEPTIVTYNETPDSENFGQRNQLKNFVDYDNYLKKFAIRGIPTNIERKLYIGYDIKNQDTTIGAEINQRNNTLKENLNKFRSEILRLSQNIVNDINNSDIKSAETKVDNVGADATETSENTRFIGIDVTDFYVKIFKTRLDLNEEKSEAMTSLNQKINNMIQTRLGMLPTIYNIFEIILNDVDEFFNVLRKTSRKAERHHEEYSSLIVNDGTYKDVRSKIYSFPLVIKQKTVCNQVKEERVAPIDLSNRLDSPFPEITLVQDFIDSFIKYQRIYEQATLKQDINANGDYKWMPFTPTDCTLVSPNINSPYFGKDSPGGGSSQQPIDLNQTDKLSDVLSVTLKRFYILSQNTFAHSFYSNNKETAFSYIDLYAKTEAINLVNSITNEQYGRLLETLSIDNNSPDKIGNFYNFLNSNVQDLFTDNDEIYYSISNGEDLYRNKNNPQYKGIEFININKIAEKDNTEDVFGEFIDENKNYFFKTTKEGTFTFTQENIILRRDRFSSKNILSSNQKNTQTKFIISNNIINRNQERDEIFFTDLSGSESLSRIGQTEKYSNSINLLGSQGNGYFENKGIDFGDKISTKRKYDGDIVDVWCNVLAGYGDDIYNDIIETENKSITQERVSAIQYLSIFGQALSAFNYYPYALNRDYFTTPSIIEIPTFIKLYMGALVNIEQGDNVWNELVNFYQNGGGVNIQDGGVFIFADIYDINTYLSFNDKEILRLEYLRWFDSKFNSFSKNVKRLYETVNQESQERCTSNNANKNFRCKRDIYNEYINPNPENSNSPRTYTSIITDLIKRTGLACFNDITFRREISIEPTNYESLSTTNNNQLKLQYNNRYWSELFKEVNIRIKERLNNLEEQAREFRNSTGDEDIMNQTYYSFKNLNDKWLSGLDNKEENSGYPFKQDSSRGLISQFAFVDRAMNPIGDTIIDPQAILDAKDNPETSIFTVLSQLLSLNGFEFFPLQNFLNFEEDEWTESFKIQHGYIEKEYPMFVCMYIGGSSSYPTGLGFRGEFEDDGIIDLNNPGVADFLNAECVPDPDRDRQIDGLIDNANILNKVRAFRVRYGEQNQNMFYNFEVDSNEYPETNESIQILSQLAGDNKQQAPVPKAQNLYSIYENRAYRATITGWGNAMIQPTQYFQLENVPLYNGAYVILSVEHDIIPNKMSTKFSGTKLLKYPIPRVTNPASILGFDGGNTDNTNSNQANSAESPTNSLTLGVGTANNPQQTQYNSMYTLEIS